MKKRKLIILGAVLILLVGMFAFVSYAEEIDEFVYTVESGCAVITGYNGDGGDVIVPSTIDGYNVIKIGARAFEEIDTICTITLSDGITAIDEYAFMRVSANHIVLPDSVVSIGAFAFAYCNKLQSVELSDNLEIIGESAFKNTGALKSIVLPKNSIDLGAGIFDGSGIRKIVLPDNLEIIPVAAFHFSNLREITIPASVKQIGYGAFDSCLYLKKVTFLGDIEEIGASVFANCNRLTSINIPDSVRAIEKNAFSYCFALAELKLPAKLETIGEAAFIDCVALTKVILPDAVSKIEYSAFANCKKLQYFDFNNVKEIGKEAFVCCYSLEQVVFGKNLKKIGKSAFNIKLNQNNIYVCYKGNKDQWRKISFNGNSLITNAKIHFNYTDNHKVEYITTKATLKRKGSYIIKCKVCSYSETVEEFFIPCNFSIQNSEYTYNGKTKTPSVSVMTTIGDVLKKDTDYTVSYEDGRKYPGKYTVKITFKGNYEGVKRLYFKITPRATSKITASQTASTITLKWNKVTGADGYRVYKYNSKTKKYKKIASVKKTSHKISKLSAGTVYKYKVRAYTKDDGTIWGAYSSAFETATKCKTPSITKLSSSKGKVGFTWSNVAGESGYQVYYSTNKSKNYKKLASYKVNVTKGSKSKLKKGKTYYFKVRAYTKTDSGTVYSAWSSVKSVKVK